jgi:hypothetical protein
VNEPPKKEKKRDEDLRENKNYIMINIREKRKKNVANFL